MRMFAGTVNRRTHMHTRTHTNKQNKEEKKRNIYLAAMLNPIRSLGRLDSRLVS